MLSTMTAIKRPEFKEKFVELSQEIFKEGSALPTADSFWDDYLILPVNVKCLTRLIRDKSDEELLDIKKNLSTLFVICLNKIDPPSQQESIDQRQEQQLSTSEQTRQRNSITILTVLFRSLFLRKRLNHFNVLSILTEGQIADADMLFSRLIKAVEALVLSNDNSLRPNALHFLLILACGNDNVNENGMNGYFMANDICDSLLKLIIEGNQLNETDFHDILMLWGILSNYNKYEFKNVYLSQIRALNNSTAFKSIVHIYTETLQSLTQRYISLDNDEKTLSDSVIYFISKWFGSYTQSSSSDMTDATTSSSADANSSLLASLPSVQVALLLPLYELLSNNVNFVKAIVKTCLQIDIERKDDTDQRKSTFLASLLSFASYLFENNRTERTNAYSRLLLIILLRLTEHNDVLKYFAAQESQAVVRLCRHRSPRLPSITTTAKRRSLFCVILDTMLAFVRHNVKSKLDLISYKYAFSIIYRVLCYLNKHTIRLEYHWSELWTTLTSHMQFTASHLSDLNNRDGFKVYLVSFIGVLNMCVTHGETFLPNTKSYDRLYYELIRVTDALITVAGYVTQEKTLEKERGPASITANEFHNLQLIFNHFKPAIDEWQIEKRIKYPTPEQVMSVINDNYATLELKPTDKIDTYIIFKEIPDEMGFFRYLLRIAVVDYLDFYTASISVP